jgi:hypothetical protein
MIKLLDLILVMILISALVMSCSNENGEQNFEDLKNVHRGMKMDQVHAVMENSPTNTEGAYWSDSLVVEEYESAFGASDHYKVIYSKIDSTVVEVQWGD